MIISLSFFISWFLIGMLVPIYKKSNKQHLAFVFLFVEIINSNVPYLLGDAFHFYKITDDMQLYISFSLYQTITIPALFTIAIFLYHQVTSIQKKAAILLIFVVVTALLEYQIFSLKIIESSGFWKLVVLIVYRLLLLFLSIFALRGFKRMCKK
jgi:hypothetical protein